MDKKIGELTQREFTAIARIQLPEKSFKFLFV
jgi:hypothetical protein